MMKGNRRGGLGAGALATAAAVVVFIALAIFAYAEHEHAYYKRLYAIDGKIRGRYLKGLR